jgi:hypothetical protein
VGTSGSYTGGGGPAGDSLRDAISDWADSLPTTQPSAAAPPPPPDGTAREGNGASALPHLRPNALLPVIGLFAAARPSGHSDGPGGGAGGASGTGQRSGSGRAGGAQRSAALSAASAGRAAGAAYAYGAGDAVALRTLGLDYDELAADGDSISIAQRIVQFACGASSDGTIEDEERREVAATVALWVLEESEDGLPPGPEEIARFALAEFLFHTMVVESAALLNDDKRPAWATLEGERQMRQAADVLAQQANLSPQRPTADEFERALEEGLETLRAIWAEG